MTGAWKIEKYARYLNTGDSSAGQWKQYDDSIGEMMLTLTESSVLVLCRGSAVMESHNLLTARAWMRAMTKRDSMLLMYKVKNETRRFRLKFYASESRTPEDQCRHCAESLAKFFPVKLVNQSISQTDQTQQLATSQDAGQDTSSTSQIKETLSGEVTLGKLAQVVTNATSNVQLPLAYQHCDISPADVDTAIRLCLTDPSFPAFVHQVDLHLQKVISGST